MDNPLTSMPYRFSLTAMRRMRPLMLTKRYTKVGLCFMWCLVITCGYWLHIRTSTATKLQEDGQNQLEVLDQCTRNVCLGFKSVLGKTVQHVRDGVLCILVLKGQKGHIGVPFWRSKPGASAGLLPETAGMRVWAFLIHLLLLGPFSTSFCFPCTLPVAKIITHSSQVFQSASENFEWGLNEPKLLLL